MEHATHESQPTSCCAGAWLRKPWGLASITLALIAGFFLLREHWQHVLGIGIYWPYILLLVCPLMHLFHGHGDHGHHRGTSAQDRQK